MENEKCFAFWLGFAPNHRISGGKVLSRRTNKVASRAAVALRLAAQSLEHSKSFLGAYYRKMKIRKGAPKAITATAHKLARILYRLLKHGHQYVDSYMKEQEERYRQKSIANLKRKAKAHGYMLVPNLELTLACK